MPRELVHWYVAEQTAAQLQLSAPSALLWHGAMAPDVLFFHREGRGEVHCGEQLHGTHGEDTYVAPRELYRAAQRISDPVVQQQALELLIGYLTHMATDIVFHPAVYFLTGRYYSTNEAERVPAVVAHRLLECRLDLWLAKNYPCGSLPRVYPKLTAAQERLLIEPLSTVVSDAVVWRQALADVQWIQRTFYSTVLGAGVRLAAWLFPRYRTVDSLYAFARYGNLEVFNESFAFANPMTGETREACWAQLLDGAVQTSVTLCRRMLAQLHAGDPQLFADEYGASLNFGVPRAPVEQAIHYLSAGKNCSTGCS